MDDLTRVPVTRFGIAAAIVGLCSSFALIFSVIFIFFHWWFALISFVCIALFSIAIETLSDDTGTRNFVHPFAKSFMYGLDTIATSYLAFFPPFLVPFGFLTASVLYFIDYRQRRHSALR